MWDGVAENMYYILIGVLLIFLNAFFVAAEFALVKIRPSRVKVLLRKKKLFSKTADWLVQRLNNALSACQLGITMASIGLGWIGEPALYELIKPLFFELGFEPAAIHAMAFVIAFSIITALHVIAGEQAPKLFAIFRPEMTLLACALLLKIFYLSTYPFMWILNKASVLLLKVVGVRTVELDTHEAPLTEDELRSIAAKSYKKGKISKSKHDLLERIFDLDVRITRQIMVPRPDVVFFKEDQSIQECLKIANRTKHTRFPLCKHSLDDVIGVIHIKDFLEHFSQESFDLRSLARPSRFVPETLPVSNLLKKFKATKQHLAFVLNEHGAVEGIVTLENALEELVGAVQDEFDVEDPMIVPDGPGAYMVLGGTPLDKINEKLNTSLKAHNVDTISGLLFKHAGRMLKTGDRIQFEIMDAEVMEVRSSRAWKIRITLKGDKKSTWESDLKSTKNGDDSSEF